MSEILLIINFENESIKIKCQRTDLLKGIIKSKHINIKDFIFYYKSRKIEVDDKITLRDIDFHKKKILLFAICLKKSIKLREVICPLCKYKEDLSEPCLINYNDFKVILSGCSKGHNNTVLLDTIIEKNLFHNFNYDEKKNICKYHTYETYNYFCTLCQQYICSYYKDKHEHNEKIMNFDDIIPYYDNSIEYIKKRLAKLRNKLDIFKSQIKIIKSLFKETIDNLELYYDINLNLIKNYYINKKNYKTLKNISSIKFDFINETINSIIEEEDINLKFKNILMAFEKITFKKVKETKFEKRIVEEEENIFTYNNNLEDGKQINTPKIATKYKLKYHSILDNLNSENSSNNINRNEFLCNILITPSNIELSNRLPCLSLLSYYYQTKNVPELIYYIALKCKKYEEMINNYSINPIFLIKIFMRAAHFLLMQKNYFYSMYFILKCKSLIKKDSNILQSITSKVSKDFEKIGEETNYYLLREKMKFNEMKLEELLKIKKLFKSILNEKSHININYSDSGKSNDVFYAINKKWLIKANNFIDSYITMKNQEDEDFFLNEAFKLQNAYSFYLSPIKNLDNFVAFPGIINNFQITSFKDYLNEEINTKKYNLLKNLKFNEDYYLLDHKDWKEIKSYFDTTNEIVIKDNAEELIEIKFILFDKRINFENDNANLLKKKYIIINEKNNIKQFQEKIISSVNNYFNKGEINSNKKANLYFLGKERKDMLVEICYSYACKLSFYKSFYINKLDTADITNISDLLDKDNILIVEICNINEPSFFVDINSQSTIFNCDVCRKKINLDKKYNCDICNFSLFCSKECAKNSETHTKLDKLLREIMEKKFQLADLLSKDIKSMPLIDKKSLLGRVNLKNTENNYYINCVLQCLSNTEELTKYFLYDHYLTEINNANILTGKTYKLYHELLQKLWCEEKNIIDYNNLYQYISNDKKDPKIALLAFLNKLNEDLNRASIVNKKNSDEKINNIEEKSKNDNNSIITDLFQGQKKITITCCNCNYQQEDNENFLNIELNIPKKKSQIQIKLFKLDNTYIDLNFNLNEDLTIKNIIKKAMTYLKQEKYTLKLFDSQNTNKEASYLFENILYNSIEVVEFNNEYKINNIYNLDYDNINNLEKKNSEFNDNMKLMDFYKMNDQSELALYEREIRKKEISLYVYPINERENGYIFNSKEDIILSYPIILYIEKDELLERLTELIFTRLKNILLEDSKVIDIKVCYPHFLYNWGNINKKDVCSICKEAYYDTRETHCTLLDSLDGKMPISELIKIIPNNQLILFAISKKYDLKKSLYTGIKLFKEGSSNENISNTMINIYDSFSFLKEDKILDNWFCKVCKKEGKATKKIEINKMPLYLIISLNRFYEEHKNNKVIVNQDNTEIFYTELLNLDDFINNNNENYLYDLYGVIINKEYNNSKALYQIFYRIKEYSNVAYCKNQGKWISYEDEKIEPIDNPYDKCAYILFYKARKKE